MRSLICATVVLIAAMAGLNAVAAADVALPAYMPQTVAPPADAGYVRADGSIHIVLGNRGMGVVIEGWNALFEQTHPGTHFSVVYNKQGNTLNMAALVHGISMVCPLAREINGQEQALYEAVVGGPPLVVEVAHGTLTLVRMTAGLAIYVHKDNPVQRLTMDQLARIFTTGAPEGDLTSWGQLGATGEWATRPIHPYGTPEYSGYGYFMVKKKWHDRLLAPGYEAFDLAAQIVKKVGEDSDGIGFLGQGFLTAQTHLVALSATAVGPYSDGRKEDVQDGSYLLDRRVGLAVRRVPGTAIDPFVKEYLRLVLSREGQAIVAAEKEGFVPLNAAQVQAERARLSIDQ